MLSMASDGVAERYRIDRPMVHSRQAPEAVDGVLDSRVDAFVLELVELALAVAAAVGSAISSGRKAHLAALADDRHKRDNRTYQQCSESCKVYRQRRRSCRSHERLYLRHSQTILPSALCRSLFEIHSQNFRLLRRDGRANKFPSHNDLD